MTSILPKSTQVLVVGGGPAGSTTATLLAREGFDVTLVEKAIGPRYHIGESLLPSAMEIFDLIGVREKVEAHGFQRKEGAYLEWGSEQWTLNFGELNNNYKYSFQVRRAELDKLLLDHASSQGVKVFEGTEIRELSFDGARPRSASWSQVSPDGSFGEVSFDFLIDASGRSGLMATRYLQNRRNNKVFQNVAVWGYWKGANKLNNGPEGAIGVGSIQNGWLWAIPLHDGTMSVGVVIHKTAYKKRTEKLEEFYLNAVAECPLIADLLSQAELVSSVEAEQDYSYAAESFCGSGYFLVGDAACFLDPLLSTGVHLATYSAMLAAASIASVLRNEIAEDQALSFYESSFRQSYLRLLMMVSTLYDQKRGKEAYFREAQQLTQRDYNGSALNSAFLSLASGVEDMSEAEDGIYTEDVSKKLAERLTFEQYQESLNAMKTAEHAGATPNTQFLDAMEGMFSLSSKFSAEAAIEGFYVITKPHLGLGRTPEKVSGLSSAQLLHS